MGMVTSVSLLSSFEITWPVSSFFQVIMGKSHLPNKPFTENLLCVGQCTVCKIQNKETLLAITSSQRWGRSISVNNVISTSGSLKNSMAISHVGELQGNRSLEMTGRVQIYKRLV